MRSVPGARVLEWGDQRESRNHLGEPLTVQGPAVQYQDVTQLGHVQKVVQDQRVQLQHGGYSDKELGN